jgi:hypothetical protein
MTLKTILATNTMSQDFPATHIVAQLFQTFSLFATQNNIVKQSLVQCQVIQVNTHSLPVKILGHISGMFDRASLSRNNVYYQLDATKEF